MSLGILTNIPGSGGFPANGFTFIHPSIWIDLDQSLWLDNITRGLLTSGTLRRYGDEFSVNRTHV